MQGYWLFWFCLLYGVCLSLFGFYWVGFVVVLVDLLWFIVVFWRLFIYFC